MNFGTEDIGVLLLAVDAKLNKSNFDIYFMRFSFVLAALLVASLFCFAQQDLNSTVAQTLRQELNWTKNYSVYYFPIEGSNYGFVSDNGTEKFLLNVSGDSVAIISNRTTIDWVLRARNRLLLTDTVYEIGGLITTFNESRALESRCNVILGLDGSPCFDWETCLNKSCVRSQGLCMPTALGYGRPFLESMADYSKATVMLDLDTNEFMRKLSAFAERKTDALPNESALTDMLAQAEDIRSNDLFAPYNNGEGYEFCNPIPYRTDSLQSALEKLRQLKLRLTSDSGLNLTRDYIANQTQARMSYLEGVRKADEARLRAIKETAKTDFALVREIALNASQIVIGPSIDVRMAELNASLDRVLGASNYSVANEEYVKFQNASENTKATISGLVVEFDELVKLSNICSSALIKAETNVTSQTGKMKLEELKRRKEGADALMGPPVDEKYMGSIKADLESVRNQAEELVLEEQGSSSGPDLMLIGAIVLAVAVVGGGYYVVKSGKVKVKLPGLTGQKKAKEEAQSVEKTGAKVSAEAAKPVHEQAPDAGKFAPARYRVKLIPHGGTYRTRIRSVIKDKDGKLAPDGTVVTFRADSGVITPSATTKDGVVFASMAFNKKPERVTITVMALGAERNAQISFM